MGRLFLTAVFFLLAVPFIRGQQQYRFLHLDNNNTGLSSNQVNDFLRDRKGFLWIATASGLNRFDGYSFKVFKNSELDSTSLPGNGITHLFEDPEGLIWIMSPPGLCVYDPKLEKFDRNIRPVLKRYGLPNKNVRDVKRDRLGNYWFLLAEGLFRYDVKTKKTTFVNPFPDTAISSFAENAEGDIWLANTNGSFAKLDKHSFQVLYINRALAISGRNEYYHIKVDRENDLWIYANTINNGVYQFRQADKSIRHIDKKSSPLRLNNDIVMDLEVSDDGLIWIATDHGGLNIIDKKAGKITYCLNDPNDNRSVAENSISNIYKDRENVLWFGSRKRGLSYYHPDINKFMLYQHSSSRSNSLPHNDVDSFAEDKNGNIWIGTNGGGLIFFNRVENTFRQYRNDPGNPNSLSSDIIVSLAADRQGKLWIGTYFGGLDYFDGKTFKHYKKKPRQARGGISDNCIWKLMEDSRGRIWIGTLSHGLDLLEPLTGKISNYQQAEGIYSGYVTSILEDEQNNIWVGTGYGLSVLYKGMNKFTQILASRKPGSLTNNSILSLYLDSRGLLWVGTQDGLNVYDRKKKIFASFREKDGLPDNTILSVFEDGHKKIWVATPKGLSGISMVPSRDGIRLTFVNYDDTDGLQGKQFNMGASLKASNGDLFFGGVNGFNVLNPLLLKVNKSLPVVVLVDLQVNHNSVKVGEAVNGNVILRKSISDTPEITLGPDESTFSIQFAAPDYFHPLRNQYRYKLEGFNNGWITTDGVTRKATYTNLDPGEYVFQVIASNGDGIWSQQGVKLKIRILPPFWKSGWANFIYSVLALAGLILARKVVQKREQTKYNTLREKEERQKARELELMKIKFITNVSHEFRTPLTLIVTPIESLMKQTAQSVSVEMHQLKLIHRNARRLLNLVNQLLDFRRLEVQEIRLSASKGDLVKFLKETVGSFSDLWEKNNIDFSFYSEVDSLRTVFDPNKIERVMFNLISNAFKFTPQGGTISVKMEIEQKDEGKKWVHIRVTDNGIGISKENQQKVFDRFFQTDLPSSMINEGSGIGLAIAQEFVKLHGGMIEVESVPNQGSRFTVSIPVVELPSVAEEEEVNDGLILTDPLNVPISKATAIKNRPTILLVDDNEDFRFYLKDNLKAHYQIEEAENGIDGLQKVIKLFPDMVVSDLMMPEMDGIAFCKAIRLDPRISHTPFILLTSRSSEQSLLEGLKCGADDYIIKPFSFEILQARIGNLIARRNDQHRKFQRTIDIKSSEIAVTSLDEKLIEKAIKIVEDHLADPELSVENLSYQLGMSRTYLHRKILALTGKPPVEFIRIIRLTRAAQLLVKSQLSVSEVAYQVGFNDPKYFTKCFKEHFKVLPSLYAVHKTPD